MTVGDKMPIVGENTIMENAYDVEMDLSTQGNNAHCQGQQGPRQDLLRKVGS